MAVGSRPSKYGDYHHRDTTLTEYGIKIGDEWYIAMVPLTPTTPTIDSVPTTDANWTLVLGDFTNIIKWRLTEVDLNDFDYAYVAAPGDNFDVGPGWVEDHSSPPALYVKRRTTNNITLKLTTWKK